MAGKPQPPKGTGPGGRQLWRAVLAKYELEEHELTLLREAVRTVDQLDALAAVVSVQDVTVGQRVNPALVEQRQLRIALARLLGALRLPAGDEDDQSPGRRPQRRLGVRGIYGLDLGSVMKRRRRDDAVPPELLAFDGSQSKTNATWNAALDQFKAARASGRPTTGYRSTRCQISCAVTNRGTRTGFSPIRRYSPGSGPIPFVSGVIRKRRDSEAVAANPSKRNRNFEPRGG